MQYIKSANYIIVKSFYAYLSHRHVLVRWRRSDRNELVIDVERDGCQTWIGTRLC